MILTFSPMRHDATLTLHRLGDRLMVNGQMLDLSGLAEGARIEAEGLDCPWLASDVVRRDGQLHLTLILPHGAEAPDETLYPLPLVVAADGPVAVPPHGAGAAAGA